MCTACAWHVHGSTHPVHGVLMCGLYLGCNGAHELRRLIDWALHRLRQGGGDWGVGVRARVGGNEGGDEGEGEGEGEDEDGGESGDEGGWVRVAIGVGLGGEAGGGRGGGGQC